MAQQEVEEPQDTLRLAAQVGTALVVNPRIAEMAVAAGAGVLVIIAALAAVV